MGIGELLLLVLAAAGGVVLIESIVRRSDLGAGVVLGLVLFDTAFAEVNTSFFVGGFQISTGDLLFVIMMTAAVARLLRSHQLTSPQRIIIIVLLLVLWSLIRGAVGFGIQPAVNEARSLLRFAAVALYFSTVEPRKELFDRIGRLWLYAAIALTILAILRWGALTVDVAEGLLASATGSVRVLAAGDTLIIAIGAIIAFPLLADPGRRLSRFLGPAMLVVVVLLQHRTVWIAAALGAGYLLLRQRSLSRHVLSASVAAAFVLVALASSVFYDEEAAAGEQLTASARATGTWEWRTAGWSALLTEAGPNSLNGYLFGRPYGSGWDRRLSPLAPMVTVSPHNEFLSVFLRLGLLGLATMLTVYALSLRGTHLAARHSDLRASLLRPDVVHVAIAAVLVYYVAYSSLPEHGVLLGLAVAIASKAPNEYPQESASTMGVVR